MKNKVKKKYEKIKIEYELRKILKLYKILYTQMYII